MPELPEVETVARGAARRVCGDRVLQAWFGPHRQPFKSPPARMARALEGRRILAIERRGKHLVCTLGAGATPEAEWVVHLGMTGRLLVSSAASPVEPHTHARLELESGRELRFVDPRRFGRLALRDLASEGCFQPAGAEPLDIGEEEFRRLFHGRRSPIKAALLNQSLLSGVGNIYADESLFRAGIRPRRLASKLTLAELERLRQALKEVLEAAIRLGGSSVSDYVGADGERGFFQLEHNVYQRTGEPCRRCATPIRRIELAGRGTHYCPRCQR
jgi:formamidopyrimidine-DNA glycosylase